MASVADSVKRMSDFLRSEARVMRSIGDRHAGNALDEFVTYVLKLPLVEQQRDMLEDKIEQLFFH
jgi:hypothetical protein